MCRWERGGADPAFGNVHRAVQACGLDLVSVLAEAEPDPHDVGLLETALALSTDERLQRLIDFAAFVEAART